MSKETYTPWDSAELLTDEAAVAEYLAAALEENDPEFFVKAVGNAARAVGMTAISEETHLGRRRVSRPRPDARGPRRRTGRPR